MLTSPVDLVDPHGRTVRDLRISVTDRCNLRCTYCMPEEGMVWQPREDLLTFEELDRVATVCVERFGLDGIRLTGGEPTVRAHLPVLVERLARLGTDLSMTTNGATLALLADDLRRAGLKRITISLDTLDRATYVRITRRDRLVEVLEGIDCAIAAGFGSVKVNVVVERGVNDGEVLDLAAFGRERGVEVRFIEFMPLDASDAWGNTSVVPSKEIVALLAATWPIDPVRRGSAPAQSYRYRDGKGSVGVIGTVTESFCGDCDRVRLTADGMFRACLFATRESDLRAILRSGGSDDDLAAAIKAEVGTKWAGHSIGQVEFSRPRRSMSQIGG